MTLQTIEKKLKKVHKEKGAFFSDLVLRLLPVPMLDENMHRIYLTVVTELLKGLEIGLFHGDEKAAIERYVDSVSHFIEEYEKSLHPTPNVPENELLSFLMEQSHSTQSQMSEILGTSQPVVSELLKGKRALTKEHIERISKHFKVSPALFFAEAA